MPLVATQFKRMWLCDKKPDDTPTQNIESNTESNNINTSPNNIPEPSTSTFNCPYCSEKFLETELLDNHIKNSHEGAENNYKCPHCGDIFSNDEGLNDHILKVHNTSFNQDTNINEYNSQEEFNPPRLVYRPQKKNVRSKPYSKTKPDLQQSSNQSQSDLIAEFNNLTKRWESEVQRQPCVHFLFKPTYQN